MNLIAKLVELTLNEMFEAGLIDWTLDDGATESFIAEMEIESNVNKNGSDYYITTSNGLFCIIDIVSLDVWHSSHLPVEVN